MNPVIMPNISNDPQQLSVLAEFLAQELPSVKTAYDGELPTDEHTLLMFEKLETLVSELANRTTC